MCIKSNISYKNKRLLQQNPLRLTAASGHLSKQAFQRSTLSQTSGLNLNPMMRTAISETSVYLNDLTHLSALVPYKKTSYAHKK